MADMALPIGGNSPQDNVPTKKPQVSVDAAFTMLRRHSWGVAFLLTGLLLLANLIQESGGFGLTAQLADFAPLAIAAMASTPSIISGGGGFDLTVSPAMTFASAVYVVWLAPHGLGGAISVPIILAFGLLLGIFNGVMIIVLRVAPVVVTLAMYFVLIGVDGTIAPTTRSFHGRWLLHLAGSVGPIPGGLITIGIPLLIWFGLGRIPYRRLLYAVGSNDAAAFSTGVNVAGIRIAAYAMGGLFAAIGGIALTALVTSVDASLATSYTLIAVASVALGGTSLWGGRGGLLGAVMGAAVIYLLGTLLANLNVNPNWVEVVYGVMLIVAVVLAANLSRTPAAT